MRAITIQQLAGLNSLMIETLIQPRSQDLFLAGIRH
jgi:hypothetical protein